MTARLPAPQRGIGVWSNLLRSPLLSALSYPHPIDRYLELIHPTWSLEEVRAVVSAVRRQTDDSVTLTLRPNRRWAGFRAGQFVQLAVEVNGVRRTRCYSPASSMHRRGEIELTLKAHSRSVVSTYLRRHAVPGLVLGLSQAQGEFVMPEARPPRLLLISAGSGITPMMSMLRTLVDEGYGGRITFLHYAPQPEAMLYREALAQLAARQPGIELITQFTQQGAAHLSKKRLQTLVPDFLEADSYVCGPSSLIETARKLWRDREADDRLHIEAFGSPVPTADPKASGDVRFARSERFAANDGRSLLEQAEAAGLRPQHGCRMGICASCVCRKQSGTVRDLQTGALDSEPDQDIRICVSVPVGTVTMDL